MLPQKILAAAFSALNLVNEAVIYIRVAVYNTQDIKTIQGKVMSVKMRQTEEASETSSAITGVRYSYP